MNSHIDHNEKKEILKRDLEEIYLGNLHTVDTDLALPEKGRLGSTFSWKSMETLFVGHDGKVTRPISGVGNRIVSLVVTAEYEGAMATKEYQVTVIEQSKDAVITELYPIYLTAILPNNIDLPPIVIAEESTGLKTTLPVQWDHYEAPKEPTTIRLTGTVKETNLKPSAVIQFLSEHVVDVKANRGRKVWPLSPGSVMLKEGSVFCDEQDKMIQHLIDTDDDQMLYNFRVAAGVDTRGALPMTGWDAPSCNLRGHTTGHYLSSLALGWSVTKKTELMDKIVYLIESLSECQNALEERGCSKGFLSAYSERQFDLLETYTPYPTIWAPYYTLDKIMSGLYDCYSLADSSLALNILCKMGDWVYERLSRLSRNQLDKMWSMYIAGEFGGMISVMVKLYTLTKKKTYLQTAYYFDNEKLFYPMQENIDTLKDMHANQHIPQIMGAVELYEADGSGRYYDIAKNFWNIVTASHVYSIGGIGETEMFHEPNEIMTYITDKTAESCASYNILRLTGQLFALEPERRKMDFYETVLYNHILSSFSHKSDGGTTYFMPLRPGGHKEFNTKENTCCHGSGLETRFRYVQDIYACNHDTLYINLYIPSAVEWENFRIEQTTASDAAGTFIFLIHSSGWRNLAFRIPHWAEDEYKVTINNQESVEEMAQDGYFYLHRDWREGDRIEILTPYHFRKLPVPDGKPYACMAYGPYILAALSDQEEYLPFPELTGDDRVLTASISNMRFQKDDVDFVPLAVVTNQKYHVYFEDCSHERHS